MVRSNAFFPRKVPRGRLESRSSWLGIAPFTNASRLTPPCLHSVRKGAGQGYPTLRIGALAIRGMPMTGRPDLVLREKGTGRILVIELKTSACAVPSDGWPNMAAQLWAYSKIDLFKKAPAIVLCSEVWSCDETNPRRRWTVQYDCADPQFQLRNQQLFDVYVGHMGRRR